MWRTVALELEDKGSNIWWLVIFLSLHRPGVTEDISCGVEICLLWVRGKVGGNTKALSILSETGLGSKLVFRVERTATNSALQASCFYVIF